MPQNQPQQTEQQGYQAQPQPQRRMTWHEVDARAEMVAGEHALVGRAHEPFTRFPGLRVKVIDRLNYYDPAKLGTKLSSSVYGMSMDKLWSEMPELCPKGYFKTDEGRSKFANNRFRDMWENVDKGYAFQQMLLRTKDPRPYPPDVPRQIAMTSYVTSMGEMSTRHEIIAPIAGLSRDMLTAEIPGSLSEVHAFVRNHELQHSRTSQMWVKDPEFIDEYAVSDAEKTHPVFTKLKAKAMQAPNVNDKYLTYLNEQVSDTYAALKHLQSGGDKEFVKLWADVRAYGAINGGGDVYYPAAILDFIHENADLAVEELEKYQPEDVEKLAVSMVAEFSWDRDEYYLNAMASRFGAYQSHMDSGSPEERIESARKFGEKKAQQLAEEHGDPKWLDCLAKNGLREYLKPLYQRGMEAQHRLVYERGPEGQLNATEHMIEIQAAVRYNQHRHPEFDTPYGALHLLMLRERTITADEGELNKRDKSALNSLSKRYGKEAEQLEIEKALNQSHEHQVEAKSEGPTYSHT